MSNSELKPFTIVILDGDGHPPDCDVFMENHPEAARLTNIELLINYVEGACQSNTFDECYRTLMVHRNAFRVEFQKVIHTVLVRNGNVVVGTIVFSHHTGQPYVSRTDFPQAVVLVPEDATFSGRPTVHGPFMTADHALRHAKRIDLVESSKIINLTYVLQ